MCVILTIEKEAQSGLWERGCGLNHRDGEVWSDCRREWVWSNYLSFCVLQAAETGSGKTGVCVLWLLCVSKHHFIPPQSSSPSSSPILLPTHAHIHRLSVCQSFKLSMKHSETEKLEKLEG